MQLIEGPVKCVFFVVVVLFSFLIKRRQIDKITLE